MRRFGSRGVLVSRMHACRAVGGSNRIAARRSLSRVVRFASSACLGCGFCCPGEQRSPGLAALGAQIGTQV